MKNFQKENINGIFFGNLYRNRDIAIGNKNINVWNWDITFRNWDVAVGNLDLIVKSQIGNA